MRCPDCGNEMIAKSRRELERFYHWEDEEFYYREVYFTSYRCKHCGIQRREDGVWLVPKFYKPTEKQVQVITIINDVLGTDFEPITRAQCCKIIAKYMDRSKKVAEADKIANAMYMQEFLDESDFF